MKQLYLFWLTALILLGVTVPATAADTDCIFTWDIPGAIEYRSGIASNATVTKLDGQTSYAAPANSRPYFFATEGYLITGLEGNKVPNILTTSAGEKYVSIFNSPINGYQGNTIKINVVKLSDIPKDKSFTLDIENGASYLESITLTGTGQKIDLKNGPQTIQYASDIDSQIQIVEKSANKIFSVKKDDTAVSKRYNWDSYYNVDLTDGATISVRVFEDGEPAVEKSKVTFEFADEKAKNAVAMLWSKKQGTIKTFENLEFEKDDQVKLTLNTWDYVVTLKCNGTEIPVSDTSETFTWTNTFTENATVSISAKDREFGTVNLSLNIDYPEGIILHEGKSDGPVIDLSQYTPSGTTYTIPVNAKYPKIFFEEAEGWWIKSAQYYVAEGEDKGWNDAGAVEERFGTVVFKLHKINETAKVVIYFDGDTNKFNARAGRSEGSALAATHQLKLQQGYNEYIFDPVYTSEISIQPLTGLEGTVQSSLFVDGRSYSIDSEKNAYIGLPTSNGTVMHFFCAIATPAKHQLSVNIADKTTVVTYDKLRTHPNTSTTLAMFEGTEVSISPREGCDLTIDGKKIEIPATRAATAGTHTFTVTGEHSIEVAYNGTANVPVFFPATGETVETLESVLISFPEAKTAERNTEMGDDEISLVGNNQNYAAISVTVEKVEADVPTFRATFNPAPVAAADDYKLMMSQGFFTVDGDLLSTEASATFKLSPKLEEINYMFEPDGTINPEWGIMAGVVFDESVTVQMPSAEDIQAKMTVKFNDQTLSYPADYTIEPSYNMFIFMLTEDAISKLASTTGELYLKMDKGLLDILGNESPEIEHTWTVAGPKEYTFSFEPDFSSAVSSLTEIIVSIPEADKVEIGNERGASLRKKQTNGYGYDYWYGTITEIEAAPSTRADAAQKFKVTFDKAPTENGNYELQFAYGTFVHDGLESNPFTKAVTLDTSTGITEIGADAWVNATIYSIDGRLLFKNADKAAVESLEKGLYIVNGKKMLKK